MPIHTVHSLPFPCIGTLRSLDVFTYGPVDSPKSVYIQAALHADELPGGPSRDFLFSMMERGCNDLSAGMRVAFDLRRRLLQLEDRFAKQRHCPALAGI